MAIGKGRPSTEFFYEDRNQELALAMEQDLKHIMDCKACPEEYGSVLGAMEQLEKDRKHLKSLYNYSYLPPKDYLYQVMAKFKGCSILDRDGYTKWVALFMFCREKLKGKDKNCNPTEFCNAIQKVFDVEKNTAEQARRQISCFSALHDEPMSNWNMQYLKTIRSVIPKDVTENKMKEVKQIYKELENLYTSKNA